MQHLQHRGFVSQAEAVHAFYDNYLCTGSVSLLSLSMVSSSLPLCDLSKNTSQHNHEPKHKTGHMSVLRGKLTNNTSVLVDTGKGKWWWVATRTRLFLSPLITLHLPFPVSTQHTQDGFKQSCKMLHFKMFHPWLPFVFVSRCIIFGVINSSFKVSFVLMVPFLFH